MIADPGPTVSWNMVRYHVRRKWEDGQQEELWDRYRRLEGANLEALARAHAILIGCGGLGGEVGHGLVRKGVGRLTLLDFDAVELSNLPRQFFRPEDVTKNKALALAANLRSEAIHDAWIEGHARSFQDARDAGLDLGGDIAIVGVDNNPTRIAAASYYLARRIPVIFLAVDRQALRGYVFVQQSQPGEPCFQCLFPDAEQDRAVHGCAGASIEILKVVAGIALHAVDSLLTARPRGWNYKEVFLDQGQDGHRRIGQRRECPLCGGDANRTA